MSKERCRPAYPVGTALEFDPLLRLGANKKRANRNVLMTLRYSPGAGGGGRTLTRLPSRDFESAMQVLEVTGNNRQEHESIGGSQNIGSPLSYPIGFRRQGLLHILLHSPRGG